MSDHAPVSAPFTLHNREKVSSMPHRPQRELVRSTQCGSQLLSPSAAFLITTVEFGAEKTRIGELLPVKSQSSKKSSPSLKTTPWKRKMGKRRRTA